MTRSSVGKFNIEVIPSLSDAEVLWRSLEAHALVTPYQCFDWVRLWREHFIPACSTDIVTVLVRRGENFVAIFPFEVGTRSGFRMATMAGGRHVNFQMPLSNAGFVASETEFTELLRQTGSALNVDAVKLQHQPGSWGAALNPLSNMLRDRDSNSAFMLKLDDDFVAVARSRRSARSLQQIRRKRRNLEAFAGPVAFERARDPETCARVIDAAIGHRAVRRRTSGIPSFFDVDGGEGFVRAAAKRGLEQPDGDCTLAVHYLEAGGSIIASYFGSSSQGAYSCFLNAFDLSFQKFSPGDIILHDLIEHLCQRGLRQLDLGVGDARYKRVWCDEIQLYATTIPITVMGSLYCGGLRPLMMAKRAIKRNRFLLGSWRAARRLTA